MAFTHLQPAEPTTLGYRLAVYAQDLLIDEANLRFVFENLTAKGLRGAVGTVGFLRTVCSSDSRSVGRHGGARARTFRPAGARDQHADLSAQTRLPAALGAGRPGRVAFEVCGRRSHSCSARRSAKCSNRSAVKQVGSSAMPFKRNPILCERIDSLARLLPGIRRRRLAERRDEFSGAHARRQREPAHDSARSAAVRRRNRHARAQRVVDGLRVDETRIARKSAHVRAVCRYAKRC